MSILKSQKEPQQTAAADPPICFIGNMDDIPVVAIPALKADHKQFCSLHIEKCRHSFVTKAIQFISQNRHRKYSMRDAAKYAGSSTQHFCRIFRRETGQAFTDFAATFQADRARRLLLETHAHVKEIAIAAGYGSIAQFNRMFKRIIGVSPSKYRSATHSEDASVSRCPFCGSPCPPWVEGLVEN